MTAKYLLWLLTLDVQNGAVTSERAISGPLTVEDCIVMQVSQGPQKPVDGKVAVFNCRRLETRQS